MGALAPPGGPTALVCVSEGEAATRPGGAASAAGYEVVRNGVDLDAFPGVTDRGPSRAALGLDTAPLAVCVGRLARQKGQDLLLRAWPAGARRGARTPGWPWSGTGRTARRWPPWPRRCPRCAWSAPSTQVARWYAAADVVVLPSRWEGLALTPMEAMASGRPVVLTDIAGSSEIVAPGTGEVVPTEDPTALARALVRRLADRTVAAAEGAAAAAHARAELGVGATYDRLAALTEAVARP